MSRNRTAVMLLSGTFITANVAMAYNNNMLQDLHIMYSTSNGGSNGGSGGNGGPSSSGGKNGGSSSAAHAKDDKKDDQVHVNRYIDQTVLKAGTRW
jgi:hypothetical protein